MELTTHRSTQQQRILSPKAQVRQPESFSKLPGHILTLHVLDFLSVGSGRSLCKESKSVLDQERESRNASQENVVNNPNRPAAWLADGMAPSFPLKITLSRYSSFGVFSVRVDYELTLKNLQDDVTFEARSHEVGSEKKSPSETSKGTLSAKEAVRLFEEVRQLRRRPGGSVEYIEKGKPHFEVRVSDSKDRLVLHHLYKYRFPRTPVDGVLDILLAAACSTEAPKSTDFLWD